MNPGILNMRRDCFWILLATFFLLIGCSQSIRVSESVAEGVAGNPLDGLLLVSIGRSETSRFSLGKQLPFVNYRLVLVLNRESGQGMLVPPSLASEVMEPQNLFGHLGTGKYGVIHLRRVPAGEYILMGYDRGDLAAPYASYLRKRSSHPNVTGIPYRTHVLPGVLNYAGELLVTKDASGNESIVVSNQFDRDFKFASDHQHGLENFSVATELATRSDSKQ